MVNTRTAARKSRLQTSEPGTFLSRDEIREEMQFDELQQLFLDRGRRAERNGGRSPRRCNRNLSDATTTEKCLREEKKNAKGGGETQNDEAGEVEVKPRNL